jgi:hypothetical protein
MRDQAEVRYRGGATIKGFRFSGGILQPRVRASWPLASLTAHREMLRLSIIGWGYSFAKDAVRELREYSDLFSIGLRIVHRMPDYPNFLVFWTSSLQALKKDLENLGYEVV